MGAAEKVLHLVTQASAVLDEINALQEHMAGLATEESMLAARESAELDTVELYVVTLEATVALVNKRLGTCTRLVDVLKKVIEREAAPAPAKPKRERVDLAELVDPEALRAATDDPPRRKVPARLAAFAERVRAAGIELPPGLAALPALPAAHEELPPAKPRGPRAAFGEMPVPPEDEDAEPVFPDQELDKRLRAGLKALEDGP